MQPARFFPTRCSLRRQTERMTRVLSPSPRGEAYRRHYRYVYFRGGLLAPTLRVILKTREAPGGGGVAPARRRRRRWRHCSTLRAYTRPLTPYPRLTTARASFFPPPLLLFFLRNAARLVPKPGLTNSTVSHKYARHIRIRQGRRPSAQ